LCLTPIHSSPRHRSFHVCSRSEHPNSASPADDLLTQPPAGASTSAQPIAVHETTLGLSLSCCRCSAHRCLHYLHRFKSLDATISAAAETITPYRARRNVASRRRRLLVTSVIKAVRSFVYIRVYTTAVRFRFRDPFIDCLSNVIKVAVT